MDLVNELLRMKKEAKKEQNSATELRGRLKQLMEQLQTDYNFTSIEQAEEYYNSIEVDYHALEEKIKICIQKVKEDYGF